jgi:hypothetical protein
MAIFVIQPQGDHHGYYCRTLITDHCSYRRHLDPGYAEIVELRRRLLPYRRRAYRAERHLSFHTLTFRTPFYPDCRRAMQATKTIRVLAVGDEAPVGIMMEDFLGDFGYSVVGRIEAVGLGEEQLLNRSNPEAAENRRVQLINIGK